MKNILKTSLLFVFVLLWEVALLAQPSDDDTAGTLESEDAPAAPIDNHLIWLGVLGTLYAGYYFYSKTKKTAKTY